MRVRLTQKKRVSQSIVLDAGTEIEAYIAPVFLTYCEYMGLCVGGYGTSLDSFEWEPVIELGELERVEKGRQADSGGRLEDGRGAEELQGDGGGGRGGYGSDR